MGRRSKGYIVTTYVADAQHRINKREKIDPDHVVKWARQFAISLSANKDLAYEAADDVVASVWGRMSTGELVINDKLGLWPVLSEKIYRKIRALKFGEKDFDAVGFDHATEDGISFAELGYTGRTKPDQIPYVYLNEISAQIDLLPDKQRHVMQGLKEGYDALDIAKMARIPVHTVFRRIRDARHMMFNCGLWDGKDWDR